MGILKKLLLAIASLSIVLCLACVAFVDLDQIATNMKTEITATLKKETGRDITWKETQSSWWPPITMKVTDITMSTPYYEGPQLLVPNTTINISIWSLIKSFGQSVSVDAISVSGAQFALKEQSNGDWDIQDILDRLEKNHPAQPDDTMFGFLEGLHVNQIQLLKSNIFVERQDGHEYRADMKNITFNDVALGQKTKGSWDVSIQRDNTPFANTRGQMTFDDLHADIIKHPLHVSIQAENKITHINKQYPLDAVLDITTDLDNIYQLNVENFKSPLAKLSGKANIDLRKSFPIHESDFDLNTKDVSALFAAIPKEVLGLPDNFTFKGPVTAAMHNHGENIDVSFNLDDATLIYDNFINKAAGVPMHFQTKGNASDKSIKLAQLGGRLSKIVVSGTADIPLESGPLALKVNSNKVALDTLFDVLPVINEARQMGQVSGDVEFKLNITPKNRTEVIDADILATNLNIKSQDFSISGHPILSYHQALTSGDKADFTAKADLSDVALTLKDEKHQTVVKKSRGQQAKIDAKGSMKGVDSLQIETMYIQLLNNRGTLKGSIPLSEKSTYNLTSVSPVQINIDNGFAETLPQYYEMIPHGTGSMNIAITGSQTAPTIALQSIDFNGDLGQINGNTTYQSSGRLDIDMSQATLKLNQLAFLSDAFSAYAPNDNINMALKGTLSDSANDHIDINVKSLKIGESDMRGSMKVANFASPDIEFALNSTSLDPLELMGEEVETNEPDPNPHGLSPDVRASLQGLHAFGTIQANRLRWDKLNMTDAKLKMDMNNGLVKIQQFDAKAYDGTLTATGSNLDLMKERTDYDLVFDGQNISLDKLMTDMTGAPSIVSGVTLNDVKVNGNGLALEDFQRTLSGNMALSSAELTLNRLGILAKVESIIRKVKTGFKLPAKTASVSKTNTSLGLQGFQSTLKIVNGGYQMDKPIQTSTPLGLATLKGGGNLAGELNADMTIDLKPALLGLSGSEGIPLSFHIGGSHNKPTLTGFDAKKLLAALALGGAAKVLGDSGVLEKAGIDSGAIPTSVDDAKNKAKDAVKKQVTGFKKKATKKVDDAKSAVNKRVEAEKKKAKAEADKAKKKAKERAKEEAGKVLKKFGL